MKRVNHSVHVKTTSSVVVRRDDGSLYSTDVLSLPALSVPVLPDQYFNRMVALIAFLMAEYTIWVDAVTLSLAAVIYTYVELREFISHTVMSVSFLFRLIRLLT